MNLEKPGDTCISGMRDCISQPALPLSELLCFPGPLLRARQLGRSRQHEPAGLLWWTMAASCRSTSSSPLHPTAGWSSTGSPSICTVQKLGLPRPCSACAQLICIESGCERNSWKSKASRVFLKNSGRYGERQKKENMMYTK